MNRRLFLKTAGILAIAPSMAIANTVKKEPFTIKIISQPFCCDKLWVCKDGYWSSLIAEPMSDLIDCHGLDAGWELTDIIVREIEFDMKTAWKMYSKRKQPFDKPVTHGIPKRCTITKIERRQIYIAITAMRNGWTPEKAIRLANRIANKHIFLIEAFFHASK